MDLMPPRRSFPEALTQRVECWVYGEGSGGGAAQKSSSESGEIGRRDIAHWLGEPPRKSLVDNKTPVAGLRLICHRQVVSIERPFDEPTFRAIHAALGLPERHEYLTALNAGACGKYVGAAENPIFIYHRFNNNLTISAVIKYDSASNITRGYILTGPRISIDKVCDEIMSQFPYINHPLLIPTVLVELTAAGLMSELYQIERFLARSETMSLDNWKFDNWELGNVTPNILDGEEHKKKNNEKKDEAANGHEKDSDDKGDQNGTPGENRLAGAAGEVKIKLEPAPSAAIQQAMENFSSTRDLALWLGKISQRYAYMKVTVQSSILMAEFTLREIDNMEASAVTPDQFRRLAKVTNGECLRHRVELLLSNLHHMVLFTALDQRIQAQQNILYNLIAQNDSSLNIEIAQESRKLAEASKRDSAAMKIIAVLTTIFLPGTFFATLFAMPLFDWSAISISDVGTSYLWIYWVVAIPTTACFMVVVWVYAFAQERNRRVAAREAREKPRADRV